MAKRKRLTPAQPDHFNTTAPAPETKSMPGPGFSAPPIAQVANDAATRAALDEVTDVLRDARAQGRLIEALELATIDAGYLVRDRLKQDEEEMAALMASLRARGQQTPIEVTALSTPAKGKTYGLISGWRRLTALARLHEETGEARFATIKALVIAPESAQEAYVAMVEENEIRANLSLYERARIALRAAQEGVYPTPRHAVLELFGATSRSKRSRIGRFVTLVEALDGVLMHPTAIPEKLGVALAGVLAADKGLRRIARDRLTFENPLSAADELGLLADIVAKATAEIKSRGKTTRTESKTEPESESVSGPAPMSAPALAPTLAPDEVAPGLRLRFDPSRPPRIDLSGTAVGEALYRDLRAWLAAR